MKMQCQYNLRSDGLNNFLWYDLQTGVFGSVHTLRKRLLDRLNSNKQYNMSAGASLDSPQRPPLGIHYSSPPVRCAFIFPSSQPPDDSKRPLQVEWSQVLPLCAEPDWEINRSFPSSPGSLFQNEGRCSAFDMEIIFHSHANKTHFHKNIWNILKVRVFGTRKWPINEVTP